MDFNVKEQEKNQSSYQSVLIFFSCLLRIINPLL